MPSPDTGVHFRSKEMVPRIDEYEGSRGRHRVAKNLLWRYTELVDEGLKHIFLSPEDALLIWRIFFSDEPSGIAGLRQAPARLKRAVVDNLRATGHHDLSQYIQGMDAWHWISLIDALQRIDRRQMPEGLEDELERVGIVNEK